MSTSITPDRMYDNVSGSVIACDIVMIFFAALAVLLRFHVRGKLLRTIKIEDWLILASLVFSTASTCFVIRQATVGLGRHIKTLTTQNIQDYLQASYIHSLFYHLSLAFTKASILFLYLRFLTAHDFIRRATKVVLGFVILYSAWVFAMHMSMCIPLQTSWDRTVPGRCHGHKLWWSVTYLHIITDFIIFILPIPVVASMTIPKRQKAGLLAVFALGFFVCLISVLRTIWLDRMVDKSDMTWDLVPISKWTVIELNTAIICACLTTLKPILTNYLKPWASRCLPQHGQREQQESSSSSPDDSTRPRTIGSTPLDAFRRFRQTLTFGSTTRTAVRPESHADQAERGVHVELKSTTVVELDGDTRLQATLSGSSAGGSADTEVGHSKDVPKVEVKGG